MVSQKNTGQTSTIAYVSLLKCRLIERPKSTLIVTNSHAVNSIDFEVWISNDPRGSVLSYALEKSAATLAPLGSARYPLTGPYAWLDIRIVDSSPGDHGVGNAWVLGVGV